MKQAERGWDLLVYEKCNVYARPYPAVEGENRGGCIRFTEGTEVSRG